MKRILLHVLALVALLGNAPPARGDAPLPPPTVLVVWSPDHSFRAVADPQKDQISIFRGTDPAALWSLPGWHRWIFLANDGEHLVIGPDGLNLLPLQVKESDPLLLFMRRRERVRTVTVGELFPGLKGLQRTVSHLAWGSISSVSPQNHLLVDLVDGRRLAFDLTSGNLELDRDQSNKPPQPTRAAEPNGKGAAARAAERRR